MYKALFLTLTLTAALAAASSKPLTGRIVDTTGQGIAGASVEAVPMNGTKISTVTDPAGEYGFDGLVPGRYQINVQHADHGAAVLSTEIISGETARLNTTLRAGVAGPVRIRVGGNAQAANLIKKVPPVYPPEAKLARLAGTVTLQVLISREGKPVQISSAESPDPLLTRSAIDAVQQWEWKPTLLNGQPVDVVTQIDVNYTLSK